jgi:Predicted hydrolase of the metallo-beta-lactamase superfamily
MDIEIIAVGGYNEVGRNMSAVRCGNEIVIFDMGLRLDQMMIHEDAEVENMHSLDLIKIGAIPDDTLMNSVDGTCQSDRLFPRSPRPYRVRSRSWRTGTMRRSSPRPMLPN